MSRAIVGAALLLSAWTTTARAQESGDVEIGTPLACLDTSEGVLCTEQPQLLDGLESAAADASVSTVDLLNALETLHSAGYDITAQEYLFGKPPPVSHGYTARVRLTFYNEAGVTFGGGHTYPGSTACSTNWGIGQRFALPNGETVTCNDRGNLGNTGWLDLWRQPDVAQQWGPWATVEVLP